MSISGFDYPAPLSDATREKNARMIALSAEWLGGDVAFPAELLAEKEKEGLSSKEAYAALLALQAGLDTEGRDREFYLDYVIPSLREYRLSDFTSDPYFKAVGFAGGRCGAWRLDTLALPPCVLVPAGDLTVRKDGRLLPRLGFFREPFLYPAVLENGREWMTLLPVEQVTMKEPIRRARGRVLTLGLGLGYFAFHAAEKENVESVTVVERSPDVIRLFREALLPHFPHGEKIRIVEDDAFRFAEERATPDAFDFVFSDIWHDAGDGRDAYLRLLRIFRERAEMDLAFWLEDTILCYLDGELWPRR